MDRETLNEFIERQCEQADHYYNDGRDGYPQALMIQWAVDKYVQSNFKEKQNND